MQSDATVESTAVTAKVEDPVYVDSDDEHYSNRDAQFIEQMLAKECDSIEECDETDDGYDTNDDDQEAQFEPYSERVDMVNYKLNNRDQCRTVQRSRRVCERVAVLPEMLKATSDMRLLFESGKRMQEEDREANRPKRRPVSDRKRPMWTSRSEYTGTRTNQAGQLLSREAFTQLFWWKPSDVLDQDYRQYKTHIESLLMCDHGGPPTAEELHLLDEAVKHHRALLQTHNATVERKQALKTIEM